MKEIHPTSQHIALYLVKHGDEGRGIKAGFGDGPKRYSLKWVLGEPTNLNTHTHDLYIEKPQLTLRYTESTLGSDPLRQDNGSDLEIELDNAENLHMRGLHTREHSLTGIPNSFTIFNPSPKDGECFNVPMDIINPAVSDKRLRELVVKWEQEKYHEFLEYAFLQLVKR
mgnify:CR=1 FL=1|jgi:hypothetical protein